jgi:DNA replication protein DnaC
MARVDCPLCDGTGWRSVEVDGVRRVTRCDCHEAAHAESLLRQARIPPRYEHCTLENFDVLKDKESGRPNHFLERAKLYAQKFVEEYPTDFGLLFVGPTGVGKTHLAVAVLRELTLRKGIECLFYDSQTLLKAIRDSWNPDSRTSELRVLQPIADVEVLLLDELSAMNPTDWVKETLAYIINSRYNQKKVTLITTTLSAAPRVRGRESRAPSGEALPDIETSLNQLGGTLRSRLYEMCKVVEMYSDDFRRVIKQAAHTFHVE